jgi:hypothetical protein
MEVVQQTDQVTNVLWFHIVIWFINLRNRSPNIYF